MNQNEILLDNGVVSEEIAATAPAPEKKQNIGYRVMALVLCLVAIGGLFLGLLGKFVSFLSPAIKAESLFGNQDAVLSSSALGLIIEWFSQLFKGTLGDFYSSALSLSASSFTQVLLMHAFILLIALSVVVSIVLAIVALASGKAAKKCMHAVAILTVLSYGSWFAFCYTISCIAVSAEGGQGFSLWMFDIPAAIIAGVALLVLAITAIVEGKGRGVVNVVSLLLTLGTVFLFFFPETMTAAVSTMAIEGVLETKGTDLLFFISLLLVLALFAFNLYVSVIRTGAKKAYAFDCVRFGLQLIAVVLFVVSGLFVKELFGFESKTWLFSAKMFAPISMIVATVLLFAIALTVTVALSLKKKRLAEARPVPVDETVTAVPEAQESAKEPSTGFILVNAPVAEEPAAIETVAAPAAPETAAAPLLPPEPEAPMSEFERRMQALAKGEAPAEEAEQPESVKYVYRAGQARSSATSGDFAEAGQYTYDPFFGKLTAREKNEFGDLFISNKYGIQSYLPAYVIGGNNDEFFRKVFIYLGRFRRYISAELLDKLYRYVCDL